MIMTPEEAKKKWCPMARVVEGNDDKLEGPFNRYHTGLEMVQENERNQTRCFADDCMWWVEFKNQEGTVNGRCGMAK